MILRIPSSLKRTLYFFKGVFTFILIVYIAGCNTSGRSSESEASALESKDWFKSGVDRFYLAYGYGEERLHPGYDEYFGSQFFLGVGCYGESSDPNATVSVFETPDGFRKKTVKLHERRMLHEFNIVRDGNPGKGQCEILLGDELVPQSLSWSKQAIEGRNNFAFAIKSFGATAFCLGAVSAGLAVSGAVLGTGASGGTAAPLTVPVIASLGSAFATSTFLCIENIRGSKETLQKRILGGNQKVFGDALLSAANYTNESIRKDSERLKWYRKLIADKEKELVAAAYWNRQFVANFNSQVTGNFENGWGEENRFFEMVKSIQTEVLDSSRTFMK